MANRFPLILDADAQRIKELASGDNLDLTGNDISAVRNIIPETTETYDLGSTDNRWRDLFLSGQSIHLDDGVISYDSGTNQFTFFSEIEGSTIPANLELNGLTVNGDLVVNGSMTTINTSTLVIEDKNIELAVVETPTDTTADGGGITIKGTTDKLFRWVSSTNAWTSSEHLDIVENKSYKINGVDVLSATGLGSAVVSSALTSVGVLDAGSITSGFGNIDIGESVFTGDGSGLVDVDASLLEGQDGSYYLDYGNFSNIPTNLSNFTNDEDYITLDSISASGDLSYDSATGVFSVTTYKSADFDTDFSGKTTDGLTEGTTNLYFTTARSRDALSASGDLTYDNTTGVFSVTTYKSADFDTDFGAKTTDGLTEGTTNLYFTQSRARDSVSASGDLSYDSATGVLSVTTYKSADFDTDFGAKTTDSLTEGTTNLYFTQSRARDSVSASGDLSYDNTTGVFSATTYKSADFDTDFGAKTTDGLTEGTTNLYFTTARSRDALSASGDLSYDNTTGVFSVTTYKSADFDTNFSGKTTDGLTEGTTNLYFTTARSRDALSASGDLTYDNTTGVLSVTTYKSADFDTDFSGKTTDGLTEGTTNLYFTTARVDNHLIGGTGVTYNAGTISIGQSVATTDNVTFNDLSVTGAITSVDSVQFDTSITYVAPGKGKVVWNEDEGSLDIGLEGGVVANLPEETLYRVENQTGATIQTGILVVAAGTVGNSGKILVAPWNPSVHSSVQIMGLATQPILHEGTGYITHFGKVRGIQTNGANYGETWSNFDILYAGPLGGLTNVPPQAPNTKTIIAIVINAHPSSGTLFVRPTLSSNLSNDDRVQLTTLTNGDLLIYNSASGRFENGTGASITGNAATATALQTTRQINGTNFNGTADITTANWGTSRTVTIGLNGKEVNGSSNVTWTLGEIGAVAKAGDTMTGHLILNADPSQSLHAATKKYVDEVAQGLKAVESAFVLVDSNLSATYNPDGHETGWASLTATANGAFPTTDGVDSSELNVVGSRILLIGQTNKAHNGLYVLKTAGNGSTAWVLRRCQQCYQSSQIPGTFVFVKRGTAYANTGWVATVANVATFTVGVDAIDYAQFSGAGTFTAGSGLTLDGTVFSHTDTSSVANLSSDNSGNTFIQDISLTFDTFGHVTGATVGTGTVTVGDGTLTVNTSGAGLSGSGTFSANQSGNSTITITSNATAENTVSTIVARDASGNFAANTITASLSGNASSATALQNTRTIGMTGDVTWTSAAFNGTTNVTGTSTLANSGVVAGTYGSSTQIPVLTVDAKGRLTAVTTSSITVGNGTLTLATSGIATGSQTFTANQATNGTFTVNVPGTNIAEGTRTTTAVPITSSTGTGATLSAATTSLAGVMTSADKTKLDGIATGATANIGTVTSVGGTGTASGLTLTGTVTTSGSLTLGGTLSVLPSNFASQTANTFLAAPNATSGTPTFRTLVAADVPTLNQNTTGTAANVTGTVAVANGGTGATTAANARTNLGATTLGSNIFTVTNPSAITFPRFNADNTISALTAADFRTAIGATATGTVTSISTNNGITGGTIITTGTLGLTGQALALHNLATNGLIARTGDGTVAGRSVAAGTGISVTNGNGVSGNPTIALNAATSSVRGGVLLGSDTQQTVAPNTVSATADRSYAVQVNASGQLLVNVPWVDTNTTYSQATFATLGLVRLGSDTQQTVAASAVSATAARSYAVQVNADGRLLVNVPWVDTNTTYSQATSATLGLVRLGSDTQQTVAPNTVSATAARSYAVQVNASGQLLVNVPWVDTNTTAVDIINDTATNATRYLTFTSATSGSISAANVSSTKLQFNPNTGTLNATIFNSLSDATQKKNIISIENATDTINKINGVEFNWIDNDKKSAGVIAQEVEKILPHLVTTSEEGMKSVNYSGMIAYLIESNKELNARIAFLEALIKPH